MFIARDIANDSQAPGGAACVGSFSLDGLKQIPVFIGHLESLEKLQVFVSKTRPLVMFHLVLDV